MTLTADIKALEEARKLVDGAEATLRDSAKGVIKTAIGQLLEQDDIGAIAWGCKSSEYNDEGMYPGVHGPIVLEKDEDEWDEILYNHDLQGYSYPESPTDPRLLELKKALNLIGEDILCEIFGDEHVVVASIDKSFGTLRFESEYAGV